MALQLLNGAGAGVTSKELDVRSVGTRMVPLRVYVTGNDHDVVVYGSPTNSALNYITLGTVTMGGGSVTIEEPVDYIKITTDVAEGGAVNAFMATSR